MYTFEYIRKSFENVKTISWDEFNRNQKENEGSKVILKQEDFNTGTLRIKSSCFLILKENISFNPNRGFKPMGKNWLPTETQIKTDYDRHAYRLGFFAAITIETTRVILDLNNFTIKQSQEHRLMQRFFAVIELADQPFLPLTGPSNFGDSLDSANKVIICNGTIGLSSHHGVHGNNNTDILFQSLTFQNYEVAAISMNGAVEVVVKNVKLLGNDTNVPVLGTFSSLRFLDQFAIKTLKCIDSRELRDKLRISRLVQRQIHSLIIRKGKKLKHITCDLYNDIVECFINKDKLTDGNSYGLLFNKPSVAVNEFSENIEEYKSKNITIINVEIHNTTAKIKEIVVLNHIIDGKLKPIVDTAGSVLQIDKITNNDGCYKYNIISDYKLTLSKIVRELPIEQQKHYGTLYIPEELYHWSRSNLPLSEFLGENYTRTRNSDTMNHMNKGVNAIRVDGVDRLNIHDLIIKNTTNRGEHGIYDVKYHGAADGGHFKQSGIEPNLGYMGADVRAIGLFSVSNFHLTDILIENTISYYGKSIGIDVQGVSKGINSLSKVEVNDILASSDHSNNTNKPFSCGIRGGRNVKAELIDTKVNNKKGDEKYQNGDAATES